MKSIQKTCIFSGENDYRTGVETSKNLKDKEMHVVHIKNLKKALKHDLKPKKVHRVIIFEQRAIDETLYYAKY